VQQLRVHTIDGVVQPAKSLMVVVPKEHLLEVAARLLNKDIVFIRAGQPVTVKVESFPFTRYGVIAGEVTSVSRDAIADEKLGLYYSARVRVGETDDARGWSVCVAIARNGGDGGSDDGDQTADRLRTVARDATCGREREGTVMRRLKEMSLLTLFSILGSILVAWWILYYFISPLGYFAVRSACDEGGGPRVDERVKADSYLHSGYERRIGLLSPDCLDCAEQVAQQEFKFVDFELPTRDAGGPN
jgi:hypothetical protein